MNKINNNVQQLIHKLGDLEDIKFLLVYWQQIDGVEMNKETISTKQLLSATSPRDIINAKLWVETTRER
jgi:hypothetical protein